MGPPRGYLACATHLPRLQAVTAFCRRDVERLEGEPPRVGAGQGARSRGVRERGGANLHGKMGEISRCPGCLGLGALEEHTVPGWVEGHRVGAGVRRGSYCGRVAFRRHYRECK